MNWDAASAIGELIAAGAVLATLIYFARQMRSLKVSEFSSLASSSQQFEFTLRENLERASDLICRANSGEEMSEEARFKLFQIMHMINARYFYQYVKIVEMKSNTSIVVLSAARLLAENPAIYELWLEYYDPLHAQLESVGGERGTDWIEEVKGTIKLMQQGT